MNGGRYCRCRSAFGRGDSNAECRRRQTARGPRCGSRRWHNFGVSTREPRKEYPQREANSAAAANKWSQTTRLTSRSGNRSGQRSRARNDGPALSRAVLGVRDLALVATEEPSAGDQAQRVDAAKACKTARFRAFDYSRRRALTLVVVLASSGPVAHREHLATAASKRGPNALLAISAGSRARIPAHRSRGSAPAGSDTRSPAQR